jgi:hypothetical protein
VRIEGVDPLLDARALVLADLTARGLATAEAVSLLEDVISERRWWLEQWAEGAEFVAGLAAQDVQERLLDAGTRWPVCTLCPDEDPLHVLYISPDLGGPDPIWTCEESGEVAGPLGSLGRG